MILDVLGQAQVVELRNMSERFLHCREPVIVHIRNTNDMLWDTICAILNKSNSYGAIQVLHNDFSWKFDTLTSDCNTNNVGSYTFVMLK